MMVRVMYLAALSMVCTALTLSLGACGGFDEDDPATIRQLDHAGKVWYVGVSAYNDHITIDKAAIQACKSSEVARMDLSGRYSNEATVYCK
jgi:hypothetical protein